MENASGQVVANGHVPAGDRISLGGDTFLFAGFKRWASFMVGEDQGYPIVWVSLWWGIGAPRLRYLPELRQWFNE